MENQNLDTAEPSFWKILIKWGIVFLLGVVVISIFHIQNRPLGMGSRYDSDKYAYIGIDPRKSSRIYAMVMANQINDFHLKMVELQLQNRQLCQQLNRLLKEFESTQNTAIISCEGNTKADSDYLKIMQERYEKLVSPENTTDEFAIHKIILDFVEIRLNQSVDTSNGWIECFERRLKYLKTIPSD